MSADRSTARVLQLGVGATLLVFVLVAHGPVWAEEKGYRPGDYDTLFTTPNGLAALILWPVGRALEEGVVGPLGRAAEGKRGYHTALPLPRQDLIERDLAFWVPVGPGPVSPAGSSTE